MILSNLFHWFYTLPISTVLALTAVFTLLILALNRRCSHARWWRPVLILCLTAAVFGILRQTLLGRTSILYRPPVLVPLQSYADVYHGANREILRSNLMNVLLFFPAGIFSRLIFYPGKKPLLTGFLLSIAALLVSTGVECLQYQLHLGIFEVDDIIHNTLGAILGILSASLPLRI